MRIILGLSANGITPDEEITMKEAKLAGIAFFLLPFIVGPHIAYAESQNIPWLNAPSVQDTKSESKVRSDYLLGVFFPSNEDVNLDFYVSQDGIQMVPLFHSMEVAGRDPSVGYYKGMFYVCLVTPEDNAPTFSISRSSDLVTWNKEIHTVIERGSKNRAVWAPDLFIDEDGRAYVYFARQRETVPATGEMKFDIYVSVASNIEKGDFAPAIKVELPKRSDSYIDAQVRKINGSYYMIVKNEALVTEGANKSPLLLKSSSPVSGFSEIKDWPLKSIRGYEGFSMAVKGEKLYIYGDNYGRKYDLFSKTQHTVWIADAKDIETGPYRAEYVESPRRMRHGSVIPVLESRAKDVLDRFSVKLTKPKRKSMREKKVYLTQNDFGQAGGTAGNVVIEHFAPVAGAIYIIPKHTHVTVHDIQNPYGAEVIKFRFEAEDDSSLTVLDKPKVLGRESKGRTYTLRLSATGTWEKEG